MQPLPLVWVVDDEHVNRLLARAYLERAGWVVVEFDNGLSALRSLQRTQPDAMLLDVRMPGLSGDDLVRQIRLLHPDTPMRLVGYAAHCFPETIKAILDAGFDEVLVKPVSYQQVSDALPLPDQPPILWLVPDRPAS